MLRSSQTDALASVCRGWGRVAELNKIISLFQRMGKGTDAPPSIRPLPREIVYTKESCPRPAVRAGHAIAMWGYISLLSGI